MLSIFLLFQKYIFEMHRAFSVPKNNWDFKKKSVVGNPHAQTVLTFIFESSESQICEIN